MTRSRSPALLSMRQAAELVGWEGPSGAKRIRRHLLEIERRKERPIMIRVGGAGRACRYRISVTNLAHYCPELVDTRRLFESAVRDLVARLVKKIDRIDDRFDELESQLDVIASGMERGRR